MAEQITSDVLMIRPACFGYNAETASNNAFQQMPSLVAEALAAEARTEFDGLVAALRAEGVRVTVADDTADPARPDAVFPNNWVSFHEDGAVITYPMFSPLRRLERREDILENLKRDYRVTRRLQLESWEKNERYLEGTGSLILDRQHKIVYACKSVRTDPVLVDHWCRETGYTAVVFDAVLHDQPVYHTNVIMAIGEGIAVFCAEVIPEEQREYVVLSLRKTGHALVLLSARQIDAFAGNMLALRAGDGQQIMVMSTSAFNSLIPEQREVIEQYARIVHRDVSAIEQAGGGSVRCMIAENFLPRRQDTSHPE